MKARSFSQNLDRNQIAVRNERPSIDFRQFRAFWGLMAPRLSGDMRQGDRPRSNVLRGIAVGIITVSALLAVEVKSFAIGCRDMAAGIAATACVLGINQFRFDSDCRSLVTDLESGFSIRPSMYLGSEIFPIIERRVSNVAQVLKNDTTSTDFNRVTDQCFRCDMQEMSRYGSLMPTHSPKKATRGTSANGLNGCAGAPNASSTVIQHPALEEKCLGVGRVGGDQQAFDPSVHANDTAFGLEFRNLNLVTQAEIPDPSNSLHLGVLPSGFREARMGQCDASSKDGNASLGAPEVPPVSQRHHGRPVGAEPPLSESLQCLVAGRDLPEQGAGKLGRNPELLPDSPVEGFVQPIGVQLLRLEDLFRHPAGGGKILDHHGVQIFSLSNLTLQCPDSLQ